MRLAWLTDIHLNFVDSSAIESLTNEIRAAAPDVVLIGGDIGEADNVFGFLTQLAEQTRLPIYFVLGNHDFYGGSIADVRAKAAELTKQSINLTWLAATDVVALTSRTALIGHDGWGDGGYGCVTDRSPVLNDFRLIEELRNERQQLMTVLRQLGEETAAHFQSVLPLALRNHEHVIALTHVPPFREAAWHEGRESDENWLPYFACRAAGKTLRDWMAAHPDRRLTVLCGHTHGSGECQVLPNLKVWTGGAEYGYPRLQRLIEVS